MTKLIIERDKKLDDGIRNSKLWVKYTGFLSYGEGAFEIYVLKDNTAKYFCSATVYDEDEDRDIYCSPRLAFC